MLSHPPVYKAFRYFLVFAEISRGQAGAGSWTPDQDRRRPPAPCIASLTPGASSAVSRSVSANAAQKYPAHLVFHRTEHMFDAGA